MQATLLEFHKYNMGVGQGFYNGHRDEWLVSSYEYYLRDRVKDQTWMENKEQNEFSHWGPNSHKIEIHWGSDANNGNGKPKRVDFKVWVRKNHPEVLKEFKEAVNE